MPYPYNNYGYPAAYQQMQNTQQLMIRVSSEAEAWNYPMAPGSTMQFTDGARIYIKTMDNSREGSSYERGYAEASSDMNDMLDGLMRQARTEEERQTIREMMEQLKVRS